MHTVIRKTGSILGCCFMALLILIAPPLATAQDVLDGQLRLNANGGGTSELRLNLPEDLPIEDVVSSFEEAGYGYVQFEDLGSGEYRISADFDDLNEIFIDTWHPLSDGSVEVVIYAWIDFLPPDLYLAFALGAEDYTMTVHLPGPVRETDGRKQSVNTVVFGEQGGTVTFQSTGAPPTDSPSPSPSPTIHSPLPSTAPPSATPRPTDTVPPSATPRPTDAGSSGLSWWVWLIVGIGAALLLAVLFLVFFLVRRPPSPSISRGRFCTNCGARSEGSSQFCSSCGKPLNG